jgi:hypothetical protein
VDVVETEPKAESRAEPCPSSHHVPYSCFNTANVYMPTAFVVFVVRQQTSPFTREEDRSDNGPSEFVVMKIFLNERALP